MEGDARRNRGDRELARRLTRQFSRSVAKVTEDPAGDGPDPVCVVRIEDVAGNEDAPPWRRAGSPRRASSRGGRSEPTDGAPPPARTAARTRRRRPSRLDPYRTQHGVRREPHLSHGTPNPVIRRHMMALRLGMVAGDWASATAVFLLASIARFGDGEWMEIWRRIGLDIRVVAALFGLAWVAALWYRGLYQLRTRWQLQSEALDILRATILVAALTLSALFVFKQDVVSRLFLVILFVAHPWSRSPSGPPCAPGSPACVCAATTPTPCWWWGPAAWPAASRTGWRAGPAWGSG